MFLKAIELYGFKSFPDRTRLDFQGGLTAVVGPNGSGKSNLSDAVRWVLGEKSSKDLRAAKMQSVIFGGTQKRSPMGFAQVSLYLDNSDHSLRDMQAEEVVVTRKLYRSGESEYRINGNLVRLRDVLELFMDTGLGKDGYSIIGQGKINEIVAAKSDQRREIFEEAAGISKYRYQKNDAERRLERAEENMVRLRDIISEIEGRIEPLKIQSQKAEKFLVLEGDRKNMEISLWCNTLQQSTQTLREQQDKLFMAQSDFAAADAQIEKIQKENEEIFEQVGQLVAKVQQHNDSIADLIAKIGQSDAAVMVLQNDLKHADDEIIRLTREKQEVIGAQGDIDARIEDKKKLVESSSLQLQDIGNKIQDLQNQLTDLLAKNRGNEDEVRQLSDRASACANAIAANETKKNISADNQRWQAQLDEYAEKESQLQQNILHAKKDAENATTMLQHTQENLQSATNTKDGCLLKMTSREQAVAQYTQQVQQLSAQLNDTNNRIRVLTDLKNNMEGFSFSVKKITQVARQGGLRGIIGPVAQLLRVEAPYSVAVETALGAAAQHVVVIDENAAKGAIRYLKENKSGRATFLPLTTIKPRPFGEKGVQQLSGFVGMAADLVELTDNRVQDIVQNLLGRIAVFEDLDMATVAAKQYGFRFRIVTLDGQQINAGGSYTGGQVSKSAGVFSRQSELDKLQDSLVKLRTKFDTANEQLKKMSGDLARIKAMYEGAQSEVITLQQDKIRCEGELTRCDQFLKTCAEQQEQILQSKKQLEQLLQQALQEDIAIAQQIQQDMRQREECEQKLQQLSAGSQRLEQQRTEFDEQISSMRLKQAGLEKDVLMYKDDIINLSQSKLDSHSRIDDLDLQIENVNRHKQELNQRIQRAEQEKLDTQGEIEQLRSEMEQMTQQRAQLDNTTAMNRTSQMEWMNTREKLSGELARLDERKNTLQAEFDTIIADLYEQYGLTRQQAEQLAQPIEDTNRAKRELAAVKAKIRALGNVNVESIEEYKQVKERYDFMSSQMADVQQSKDQLTRLIADLTSEMSNMFAAAFGEIRKNFSEIFVELFGGGRASLELTDPENILQSGIELVVSPPGKKIDDLQQLSGGEQALVAISVYFAILKVKPSPFCILDEIEAALDDVNVNKYAAYVRSISKNTQFILITHRRGTMEEADVLYGVTMQEEGVSKLLKLDVAEIGSQYR